jgi:hypothetical protein
LDAIKALPAVPEKPARKASREPDEEALSCDSRHIADADARLGSGIDDAYSLEEAAMTRSSLLTFAAAAALIAATTAAQARGAGGGGGGAMSHVGISNSAAFSRPSLGSSVRSATSIHTGNRHVVNTIKPIVNSPGKPIVNTIKPILNTHKHDDWHWKHHYRYDPFYYPEAVVVAPPPVAEPVGVISVGAPSAPATPVTTAVRAAEPAPSADPPGTCLSKEYLDTGAVLFRDLCSREWAVNSTDVGNKITPAGQGCLVKDGNSRGVVTFTDTCTGEWAMNTREQMAQNPPAR